LVVTKLPGFDEAVVLVPGPPVPGFTKVIALVGFEALGLTRAVVLVPGPPVPGFTKVIVLVGLEALGLTRTVVLVGLMALGVQTSAGSVKVPVSA
jgi:hypothetical protein